MVIWGEMSKRTKKHITQLESKEFERMKRYGELFIVSDGNRYLMECVGPMDSYKKCRKLYA